ncbi:hypothetical protein [Pseudomonas sp. PH1b]|uniref:hypothetical protein n=1 Tax=Pseudomonas sp. PH1b TaxID=1397282 RepID=UPI000B20CFCE|nr:hypothetical protein [Pseudomonas sp. PH1b]
MPEATPAVGTGAIQVSGPVRNIGRSGAFIGLDGENISKYDPGFAVAAQEREVNRLSQQTPAAAACSLRLEGASAPMKSASHSPEKPFCRTLHLPIMAPVDKNNAETGYET